MTCPLRLHLLLCAAVLFGCSRDSAPPPAVAPSSPHAPAAPVGSPWFEDDTADAGVDFTYRNGEQADQYTLLETLGGGVGLIDFDKDGWLDLVLPGGGDFTGPKRRTIEAWPTRLFRNRGNGEFEEVPAAFPPPKFYTHGCAVADYDCDGWPDVLITGYQGLALFHNEGDGRGGRRFVDVTQAAGLEDRSWNSSAAWGDINGDGYPDLFVCRYVEWSLDAAPVCRRIDGQAGRDVCPPEQFPAAPDALFLNDGRGGFRNVAAEQNLREDGRGLGVVLADVDANAQPDIYVANDVTPNFLYMNRDGRLEEVGGLVGVALDEDGAPDGSMGVDAGDYDGSGRPALWVTNFQQELHALYANLGDGVFQHESRAAGLGALGRRFVGFGTAFFDVDNDGWLDLMFVNGHVRRHPLGARFRQQAVLLHNVERRGRRFFEDISSQGGAYFQRNLLGRGLAVGDLDNDGWPDVVVSHCNSQVVLLRNAAPREEEHRWLGVELVGKDHRDVVGSTLTLEVGDRRLTRFAKGGGSYLSSGDRRILFGLGPARQVGRLSVRWSWGETQHWDGLQPGRYYRLREGEATAQAFPP